MYPAAFDYHRPGSVQEAVQLLVDNPEAKILAGGHSLLPAMKLRLAQPAALIDLRDISDLTQLSTADGVRIGALVTYDEILNNDDITAAFPVLHEAVASVGDVQVRNRGTVGGSAAHADPAADTTAALLALDAEMVVQGPDGTRSIPASEFFVDIFTTALDITEVLTEIKLTKLDANTVSGYTKFPHPASGYPICGVAAVVTKDDAGNIVSARIVATGSVNVVTRLSGAEAALVGTTGDAAAIEAAAANATDGVSDYSSDQFASAEYRENLTQVLVDRTLKRILGQS